MPHELPPDLARYLSQYMDPAAVAAAELVTTNNAELDVWVSYLPNLRSFSAHREGLKTIRAASLAELLTKIAEAMPAQNSHFM